MSPHDAAVTFLLSETVSNGISVGAFVLAFLYCVDLFLINGDRTFSIRKEGLLARMINWFVFGGIFLLFSQVLPSKDIATTRAAARLAFLFLMLSEGVFQSGTMWPRVKKRALLWKQSIRRSSQ